ncbi:MAG: hypothetical protein ABSH48_17575 [Verrucomicrobiota bacterium]|jgi:hypothetical protein
MTLKQAARIMARKAGSTKTPAKAAAARENGKLGGRPRKSGKPSTTVKQ